MKTMAEIHDIPERTPGITRENERKWKEEQRELVEKQEERNEYLVFANRLLEDFCAINLIGK